MFPAKGYFCTSVGSSELLHSELAPTNLKPAKKTILNYDNLSKQEAIEVFQNMLSDLGVAVTWKWEDVNRVVQHDDRVKVLRTMADRKQAFSGYIA